MQNVSSIQEYVEIIEDYIKRGFDFFRGQISYNNFSLLPSLLRVDENNNRYYSDASEEYFINEFRIKSIPYLNYIPKNEFEWLLTAQHYGIPTRLLDWSRAPLVALFFAVENEKDQNSKNDNPVVWVLNSLLLNDEGPININNRLPNFSDTNKEVKNKMHKIYGFGGKLDKIHKPLSICGSSSNGRINAQRGVFTLFPKKSLSLENQINNSDILDKIIINDNYKLKIKEQLFSLGITYSSIFPELKSVSKEIIFSYERGW